MNQNKFNAVFVTGLVRNHTSRHVLEVSLLASYTGFCEGIVTEHTIGTVEDLYVLATSYLEKLRYNAKHNI